MRVRRATQEDIWPDRHQYHVLTYAEEGFAPLNIHTRETGLSKEELLAFADSVNARGEGGSLFPRAHLPEDGHDEVDEARLFYVAVTRATQRLFIPLSGDGAFASRLPTFQT